MTETSKPEPPLPPVAPIFVVGAGRSGTTLLQRLLSSHSRITIAPETHWLRQAEHRAGTPAAQEPADPEVVFAGYAANLRFRDAGVDEARWRALAEAMDGPRLRAGFAALLAAYGEKAGKPRVGEKTPSHVFWAPLLLDWFPDARIVLIVRDPRAQAASMLETPWGLERFARAAPATARRTRLHAAADAARGWRAANVAAATRLEADPRTRVLRYEDLTTRPSETLAALCDFLGEDFEPAMASGGEKADPAPLAAASGDVALDAWRTAHLSAAGRAPSSDSHERWRAKLTRRETALIEAICADGMARWGYDGAESGPRARAAARLAAGAARGAHAAERRLRRRP